MHGPGGRWAGVVYAGGTSAVLVERLVRRHGRLLLVLVAAAGAFLRGRAVLWLAGLT